MKQRENDIQPVGEVPTEEVEARDTAALRTMVGNIVAQEREKWSQELADELAEYEAPDRTKVPAQTERTTEARAIRVSSPTEPLYRRMTEEEQVWRSPDADHWYREWINGQFHKDPARMLHASAKLDELFGRATTAEGAAGASGALSAGTAGAVLPRPLENVILIARDRVAKMRRFASSLAMTAQTHTVPTAAAMTASMVGESTTAAQGEPTLASVQLTAKKAQVKAIATVEVLDDAAINLVNLYAQRAGGALGSLEDDQFFKDGDGTGNNVSAAFGGTAFAENTTGVLHYSDTLSMYYAVPQVYRDRGAWYGAADVLQFLSNVRDADGRPFYQGLQERPGPISDDMTAVGTLHNKPVYEVATTDGELVFGDLNALYIVGSRSGITSSASEHVQFDLDQVMFKWTERIDGNNVDTVAAQHVSGITSAGSS